jgi:DedD protein
MRFEIRAGGFFVILVGLLGLSAVVFFLGVMAGNEIAKQNTPDQAQISSTFPLPPAPSVAATPTTAPMAAINPTPAPLAATSPAPIVPHPSVFTPMAAAASPAAIPSPATKPRAAATHAVASASTPAAAPHHHPYSIQIEAVMDQAGAQQMVRRLQSLGYPAKAETTDIAGQTWYRVKVGPYPTQEEAQAAQEKLRAQYKAAYASH